MDLTIKTGDKFELASDESMWKDDLSGVFLRAPGKSKISRPKNEDYRSQLEWFSANRLKAQENPNKILFKEDEGNTWFSVEKGMNIARIKVAVEKGILVKKGSIKNKSEKKINKNAFKTDSISGEMVYDGPNKSIYRLLQKNKEKELLETIEKIHDARLLEILLDMEQKGYNPTAGPRGPVTDAIKNQLDTSAVGMTKIKEEEAEVLDLEEEIKKARKEANKSKK